jgi:outer membrane protein assembly factor BamB
MRHRLTICTLAICLLVLTGADWRQFRGSRSDSVAGDRELPLEWSDDENVAWRVDLPGRGPSSPIVVDDRVIVTCSSGHQQDRLHVLCFTTDSGRRLWEREFWATGRTLMHPTTANAAPTPASDGQHVFAFYSSKDLVGLDRDGNLCWYRGLGYDYPQAGNDVGMASSPVVSGDTVVVQVESYGDSFAAGLDTATGQTRWRLQRAPQPNWSSPVVAEDPSGKPLVLLKSSEGLDAYDLRSGEKQWSYDVPADGIPSLVAKGGRVFLPGNGLSCLELKKGKELPVLRWDSPRLNPGAASPVIHEGRVYSMKRAGVLSCADAEQGQILWQLRLQGNFWATPVLVNGHLYCINHAGLAQVVRLGARGEVAGRSDFGETIQGSPAVADNAMYVRSDQSLWKISAE